MRKALVCDICFDVIWVDKEIGNPYRAWICCNKCNPQDPGDDY